jgi:flagellar biosynthesis GTPase FlhF
VVVIIVERQTLDPSNMKRLVTILLVLVTQQAVAGVECTPNDRGGWFCEKRDLPRFTPGSGAGYQSPSRDDVKRQIREALQEHRQQLQQQQQQQQALTRQALKQERRQERALEQQQKAHEEVVEQQRRRQQRALQQQQIENQRALLQQQNEMDGQRRAQELRQEALKQQMEMQQLEIEMLRLEKQRRPVRTPNEALQPLIEFHDSPTIH